MVTSPVMEAYDQTIVGELRRMIAAGNFTIRGDVNKSTQAMIDVVNVILAPKRLALGGNAYRDIRLINAILPADLCSRAFCFQRS